MKNSERGSISIMAAIISMSILFLSLGIIQYSKIYHEQVSLDRRIDLLGDFILSDFDRELYGRYGLFGFASGKNYASIYNGNEDTVNDANIIQIQHFTSLYSNDELRRQILNFSRGRIPALILSEIEERSQLISELLSKVPSTPDISGLTDDFFNNISNTSNEIEVTKDSINAPGSNLSHSKYLYESFTNEVIDTEVVPSEDSEEQEESEENNDEELDTSELDEFNEEMSRLEEISDELQLEENIIIDENIYGNNVFSPFMQLIDQADKIIRNNNLVFIDGLMFNEYVINQFSSKLRTNETDFESLAGINFKDLSFSSEVEAEKIILGMNDDNQAHNTVQISIYSIRLLSNVIANYNNSTLMSLYRTTAELISLIIAVVSLGKLEVETEALVSAMVVIDAAISSFSELESINDGESVVFYDDGGDDFWSKIELNYYDYLRILALLIPMDRQVTQLGVTIRDNLNKDYFVDAIIHFNYRNIYWEQSAMRTFAYE